MNGRPRNFAREAAVLERLASGKSVLEVAREMGMHRNSVYYVIKQTRKSNGDCSSAIASLRSRQIAEEQELRDQADVLARQQAQLDAKKRETEYRHAIELLFAVVERAADSIAVGRSVWLSLDRPIGESGTFHDLVGDRKAVQADAESESQELATSIDAAISCLSDLHQKIVRLVFWSNQSPRAVASELGMSTADVSSELANACESMKTKLDAA